VSTERGQGQRLMAVCVRRTSPQFPDQRCITAAKVTMPRTTRNQPRSQFRTTDGNCAVETIVVAVKDR